MVGGVTKISHQYRSAVESMGCRFEYHDGCVKKGTSNLENMVRRADLVLCPVNCNSHGACKAVKVFCKRYKKTLKMLRGSGLGIISRTVSDSVKEDRHTQGKYCLCGACPGRPRGRVNQRMNSVRGHTGRRCHGFQ